MSEQVQHPDIMSARYVEEKFGMSKRMVYALLNRQDCGAIQIGARKFFHRDTFLKWLADQAQAGQKGA